jgi:hypothetical protein
MLNELISSARGRNAVGGLEPAHEVNEADVEADCVEHRQPGEAKDDRPVVVQGFNDRSALAPLRGDGIQDMPAQKVTGDSHHQAQQERDAPTPGLEHCIGHRRRKARADGRPEQDAAGSPGRRQRAHQAAPAIRRVLDQEYDRAGVFTADRKSLHHAQERQRDRRQQAKRRISRQKPDQEGRDRHCGDRESERRAPPETVADVANHHAADGPHQIAEREHAEGRKQLGHRVLVREEVMADRGGEIAVDRKIVPFEHVADQAGGDHPAHLRPIHLAFPASIPGGNCKL